MFVVEVRVITCANDYCFLPASVTVCVWHGSMIAPDILVLVNDTDWGWKARINIS